MAPASADTPDSAEAMGATNASRALDATARSSAMTVPRTAQIIMKACAATA